MGSNFASNIDEFLGVVLVDWGSNCPEQVSVMTLGTDFGEQLCGAGLGSNFGE